MIYKCYGIQIFVGNYDIPKDLYLICDTCVARLRSAFLFRLQVEIAHESFQNEFINCKSFSQDTSNSDKMNNVEELSDNDTGDLYSIDDYGEEFCIPSETLKVEFSDSYTAVDNAFQNNTNVIEKIHIDNRQKEGNVVSTVNEIEHEETSYKNKNTLPKITYVKRKRRRITTREELFQLNKNDVICKICNETFAWHNSLKRHMSIHFPNHICHICGKFCPSKPHMTMHVNSHHRRDTIETCKICNKTYNGSENLRLHMRNHSDFKHLHKCPQCPERFTTFYMRVKHLIDVHNDEPNKFKCKLCPKQFLMSGALTEHVKKTHLQERNHKCQECHQHFHYAAELRRHMMKHSGIKNFQCEQCNKSYTRQSTLKEHMKIHNNVKDYVCPICNRAFTQKCTLKGHMKVHDKVKDNSSESTKEQ
ncbi:uncharacterized protein LOC143917975 isoform X2 [Arctopsyche grandis]